MQDRSIDAFARNLARGVGRRRVAVGIAGALTGALVGPNAAFACKKVGKKCDKSGDCCHGAKCKGKNCVCKGTLGDCDGKCVDVLTDVEHCGRCDKACAAGETCCRGACADLQSDDGNCSACSTRCAADRECVAGRCVIPPGGCAPGADTCTAGGNVIRCGVGNCGCSQTTEGATVCGDLDTPDAHCGQCASSANCASFGAGAFCVATGLPGSGCCGPTTNNVCRLPCGG
jgi:stigma-specific protein Stig1